MDYQITPINAITYFKNASREKKISLLLILLAVCVGGMFFWDPILTIGFLVDISLLSVTAIWLLKMNIKDERFYGVLLIGFLAHLALVLLIYVTGFKPVGGGGDYELYHKVASQLADRFWQGNFSLDGLFLGHGFSLVIAALYILVLPQVIVANMFTIWLFVLALIFVYLLAVEIGASERGALVAMAIVIIYPSYLYFGSLMIKDTIEIPLTLFTLLYAVKTLKHFSWSKFVVFFIALTLLLEVRFYIGYAMLFTFLLSWFLISGFARKKRIIYGLVFFFILGLSPMVWQEGYYGFNTFASMLNLQKIDFYRTIVYNPLSAKNQVALNTSHSTGVLVTPSKTGKPSIKSPLEGAPSKPFLIEEPTQPDAPDTISPSVIASQKPVQVENGLGSSFVLETNTGNKYLDFFINYFKSFVYSLLGPFPWQLKKPGQYVALLETFSWYALIIASFFGIKRLAVGKNFRQIFEYYRFCIPLVLFGIIALGALSLYINNYGIILRIRIPMFICFAMVMLISFNTTIENYYNKFK